MGHGFRLTLQLVATVAAAAFVARATESARRAVRQAALDPPRHRADRPVDDVPILAPPAPHAFGPEPAIPCRSIGSTTTVIELEASGELDDDLSPTDRLLALRHAMDGTTEVREPSAWNPRPHPSSARTG